MMKMMVVFSHQLNFSTVNYEYKGHLWLIQVCPLYQMTLISEEICADFYYRDKKKLSLYPTIFDIRVAYIRSLLYGMDKCCRIIHLSRSIFQRSLSDIYRRWFLPWPYMWNYSDTVWSWCK